MAASTSFDITFIDDGSGVGHWPVIMSLRSAALGGVKERSHEQSFFPLAQHRAVGLNHMSVKVSFISKRTSDCKLCRSKPCVWVSAFPCSSFHFWHMQCSKMCRKYKFPIPAGSVTKKGTLWPV